MLALAKFALRGPYQAAAVVSAVAVLAMLLDSAGANLLTGALALMLYLISIVLVTLVVLTQGLSMALKPLLIAVAAVVATGAVVADSPEQVATLLLQWLPVVIMAQGLRGDNGSLGLALIAGLVLCVVGVGLQQVWWSSLEAAGLDMLVQASGDEAEPGEEQIEQNRLLVRLMLVALIPSLYLSSVLFLLVARHLQAKLAGSGGFGAEFRELALGKSVATAGLVVLLIALVLQQPWSMSLTLLIIFAFLFQGIAVVHSRLHGKQQAIPLLVLFYIMLIILGQIAGVLTSITGMVDNWLGLRKKSGPPDNLN